MDTVREYLVSIVAVCLIVALANVLVNHGNMQKIIRFVGGILVLLVVASPLLRLDLNELADKLQRMDGAQSFDAESISENTQEMLEQLIKENTETYIEEKAASLGATVKAEVSVCTQESTCIESIVIIGTLDANQITELKSYLSDALGIAEEQQEWKLYG